MRPREAQRKRELQFPSGTAGFIFYALADLSRGQSIGVQFVIDKGTEYFQELLVQEERLKRSRLSVEWRDIRDKEEALYSVTF